MYSPWNIIISNIANYQSLKFIDYSGDDRYFIHSPESPLVNLLGTLGDDGISPRRCASSLAGTLGEVGIVRPSSGTVRLLVGDRFEGERLLEEHEGAKHAIELQLEISDASMEYKLVSKTIHATRAT
ncbi:hypothetical protein TNIN_224461 [Trichonephila inaurata madagascariensis]|uniref:Uncharacterized protein n=1 Tax=Trichonephila inaurata madagascariensis TaxID=2747483 RepID=A0A8X6J6L6_9ARAC|nr:hypothetical protein TNIN_224461 [Trichonephila inaurata madagascariensis]